MRPVVLAAFALSAIAFRTAAQTPPSDLMRQGAALDLEGRYAEARRTFQSAIDAAPSPQAKAQAQRAMAISWAFDSNCEEAAKFEIPVHEFYLSQKDFYNAGEIANELARICIEAGRLEDAEKWYRKGQEAGLQEPNITPDRRDLWEFRTEHALARLAARRGNRADAQKHIDAAKAILDKGTNPSQAQFFPYLTGYVAFHLGDYPQAIADLSKANQSDPFILSLLAQSCEKAGDKQRAEDYYRKSLSVSNAHNPPNAYARPLARKKLGM
jgi:tetratricopeptide (TPR) repeat protein